MKKRYIVLLVTIAIASIAVVVERAQAPATPVELHEISPAPQSENTKVGLPDPEAIAPAPMSPAPQSAKQETIVPFDTLNLDVPFTPQAPTANWDAFHEEACEEAASLMVWHFFNKTPIGSTDDVEQGLASAATWERANVGTDVSIPAKDIVRMLREHFKLDAAMTSVTEDNFKKELSANHLLILPTQGQFLHNPYYTAPGPVYHMLVLRGYDAAGHFVTNDSGTKRGEGYPYSPSVLMNAIHDWNNGDVANGQKVAIVIKGLLE